MDLFGLTIARTKTLPQLNSISARGGTWWPWVRESSTGAWQRNIELKVDNVLTYSAVFACVSLIASDIAKLGLGLVERDRYGVWNDVEAPNGQAWAPVLRKPNRYQNRIKFFEQWITSKLMFGNAYALKERNGSGVVAGLHCLDPQRVTPLVTSDGAVYYSLKRDDLSGLPLDGDIVRASEIIHDRMICLFHPLVGVSPIFACGLAAMQGLSIQNNSSSFFSNGSSPGGVLTVPGAIDDATAARLKTAIDTQYTGANVGKVLVLGDAMKFDQLGVNAVDAQLIEQLKWTAENVCTCFHVPPYMIGVGPPPPYANIEPLIQAYYAQALQSLIENCELCLDEGLELTTVPGRTYGTQFDLDDLFRMDTVTRAEAAGKAITGGLSPDEVRFKYFDKGPTKGGASPMMQEQNHSLEALAKRDAGDPFAVTAPDRISAPAPTAVAVGQPDAPSTSDMTAKVFAAMRRRQKAKWVPRAA